MFRSTTFTTPQIRAWVKNHLHRPIAKIVRPPTGEYTHAILDDTLNFKVYRNKKVNNDITLLLAR